MYASPTRSALISGLLHAAAIVLVLAATRVVTPPATRLNSVALAGRDIPVYIPLVRHTGGGGGGTGDSTPASRGELPRRALRQFVPPTTHIVNDNPRLPMEPTIVAPPDVALPAAVTTIGLPDGVLGPPSNGPGRNGGIGGGDGGGIGNRRGPGAGDDGDGGGVSGYSPIRGYLTPAVLQWKAEPEYSEDARKAKLQGTVVLQIDIDTNGQARNIVIARSLGLGLDEKAVEAVRRWKFKPAYRNGKPVVSPAVVEVNFRLL